MSENDSLNHEHNDAGGPGFESEGMVTSEPLVQPSGRKQKKSEELKRNFMSVFGHGIGKLSLILVAVFIAIGAAFGYRGMHSGEMQSETASADMPKAPKQTANLGEVTESEARRRAERATLEAKEAALKGKSYQPGFDTNVVPDPPKVTTSEPVQFNVQGVPNSPVNDKAKIIPIDVPAGKTSSANSTNSSVAGTQGRANAAQAEQQAQKKLEEELKSATKERDEYVKTVQQKVVEQVQGMLGEKKEKKGSDLNSMGTFSTVSYYPVKAATNEATGKGSSADAFNKLETNRLRPDSLGDPSGKLLIKTGNLMYAETDSEANTDDGMETFATIRGGPWDGSKIIGRIAQSRNNIQFKFTVMAPQDGRPTMRIDAIALREEDAKTGVAENIDAHTLERYGSLGAASLLSGYGRAYSTTPGTTVISPGGVISTTTTGPTDKQIAGMAVGEMGTALAQEIKKGFNRPATYSTPAKQGFGLFFLQDVYEQTKQ